MTRSDRTTILEEPLAAIVRRRSQRSAAHTGDAQGCAGAPSEDSGTINLDVYGDRIVGVEALDRNDVRKLLDNICAYVEIYLHQPQQIA